VILNRGPGVWTIERLNGQEGVGDKGVAVLFTSVCINDISGIWAHILDTMKRSRSIFDLMNKMFERNDAVNTKVPNPIHL
jgi:hypothetical protein